MRNVGIQSVLMSLGADVNAERSVVLASLNMHSGRGRDGRPFDAEYACRNLQADVIVLQEVWWPHGGAHQVERAATALGGVAIHAPMLTGDRAPGTWGLAMISTFPLARYEVADLGKTLGDSLRRCAQLVTLWLPGGRLLRITNTHLTHRFASPVQLRRLVRVLASVTVPTVIAGDLNMPGPLSGLATGYTAAVIGRTFPAHRPVIQLDHMLTSGGVTSLDGKVLPPVGSDHLPIRAQLIVANACAPGTSC